MAGACGLVDGHICATEHLRGVTPDEADCLGLDERRQLDELLRPENFEDLTSQPGPPVEVPTDPRREPEAPSHDNLDIGMEAVEPMTPLEEAKENRVINRHRRAINFVEETWREHSTAESGRNLLRGNC